MPTTIEPELGESEFSRALSPDSLLRPAKSLSQGLATEQFTPLRVKAAEEEIFALRSAVICSLNQLLDLKDLNTGIHSTRLAEWALHVASELGLDQQSLADIEVTA